MASNILSLKIPNELYFNSISFFTEQEGWEKNELRMSNGHQIYLKAHNGQRFQKEVYLNHNRKSIYLPLI